MSSSEAFFLYATGLYSIDRLLEIMTAKGLRNKRGDPIHPSTLADLLANRVYVGVVSRNGLNVHGSREALVDP